MYFLILVIFHLVPDVFENILGDFLNRLDEFRLTGVAFLYALDELIEVDMVGYAHRAFLSLRIVALARYLGAVAAPAQIVRISAGAALISNSDDGCRIWADVI